MDPSQPLLIRIFCFIPLLLFTIPRLIVRDTRQRCQYVFLTIVTLGIMVIIPVTMCLITTDVIHLEENDLFGPTRGWFSYIISRLLLGLFLLLTCIILPMIGVLRVTQKNEMLAVPVPQPHHHWRNYVTYICLFIESLQLLSIAFYITTVDASRPEMYDGIALDREKMGEKAFEFLPWPLPTYFSYLLGLNLDLDLFQGLFWICMSCVWLTCVLPRILWESYLLRTEKWVKVMLPTRSYESFMLLPTIAVCVMTLDCSFITHTISINTFYPSWQCYTEHHLIYSIFSFFTLIIYVPIACGMTSTPDPIIWKDVDTRYVASYIQLQQAFKVLLLTFILIFIHVSITIALAIGVTIHIVLLMATYSMEPAVITSLRAIKCTTHLMCIWTYTCILTWRLVSIDASFFIPIWILGLVAVWVGAFLWEYSQRHDINPLDLDLRARTCIFTLATNIYPKHETQFEDAQYQTPPQRPLQMYCSMLLDDRVVVATAAFNLLPLAEPYFIEQISLPDHHYFLLTLQYLNDEIHNLSETSTPQGIQQRLVTANPIDPAIQTFQRLIKRIPQPIPSQRKRLSRRASHRSMHRLLSEQQEKEQLMIGKQRASITQVYDWDTHLRKHHRQMGRQPSWLGNSADTFIIGAKRPVVSPV